MRILKSSRDDIKKVYGMKRERGIKVENDFIMRDLIDDEFSDDFSSY